ncbi:hypothetical protein [Roseobacter phage RDJL6]|nr:hypothetical protein [Roseobacter phage RDJL6]
MRLERDGFSIEAAIEKGRALPEWYVNEPVVPPADEFYLRAFYELITGRNSDGRIPWRDIEDFAERSGLEEDLIAPFKEIMRALERTFSAWIKGEQDRLTRQRQAENQGSQQRTRAPR